MEATSPAGEPSDLKHLSDVELVRLLPVKEKGETRDARDLSTQVRLALDELWERYRKQMERVLRGKIFSRGSTLCPPEEPDKEHFLQMCMNSAYLAFLRRASKKEYKNLGGFLFTLVLRVALDVRKEISGRAPTENEGNADPFIDQVRTTLRVSYEDDTDLLVDQGKTPPEIVAAHDLRRILRKVLVKHAKESPLSLNVVVHRNVRDWTWQQIAEKRVPEGNLGSSLRTKVRTVQEFYKRDRKRILRLLGEYKITDPDAFKLDHR